MSEKDNPHEPYIRDNNDSQTHEKPKPQRLGELTVNSPVTASKPTWIVCSKSEGRDISGRSFSFFLLAVEQRNKHTFKPFG